MQQNPKDLGPNEARRCPHDRIKEALLYRARGHGARAKNDRDPTAHSNSQAAQGFTN